MDEQRNMETVRRFYGAGPSDEDSAREAYFHADAVWHVPGTNQVSGAYRGIVAITQTIPNRMAPLDDWRIELHDVMANDDLVVATVGVRAARDGVSVVTTGAHVFRLDPSGLILEAWGFVKDQAALDGLLDG